jgi:uncharacterized membrane protein YdjX (TVP38/TMEM64 family)
MNLKLKLLLGTIYLICFSALMFIIFSNFDFKDFSDINFIKNNQQLLNDFKSENILLTSVLFLIFSIIWILLLGFGSPLALFSGFVFGKWFGTLIAVFSFSIGATLLYYLANFFIRDFNKNDFLYFMLFRFTGGGMPFAIQNILPIIFDMKIKKYFFATLLGIVPGTFIVTSLGAGVGNFIGRNDSIVWNELIKDPEIYFPILIFTVVLIAAGIINKFFFTNSLSKKKL